MISREKKLSKYQKDQSGLERTREKEDEKDRDEVGGRYCGWRSNRHRTSPLPIMPYESYHLNPIIKEDEN